MAKATRKIVTHAAAQALVRILTELGYPCALCGESAEHLYGYKRVPKKVEALVLNTTDKSQPSIEALQIMICQASNGLPSHFLLTPRLQTGASVLRYWDHTIEGNQKRTCDIVLHHLVISSLYLIRNVGGLPLAPLSYLVLWQLSDWEAAGIKKKRAASDRIFFTLQLSLHMMRDDTPFDLALHESSKARVTAYCTDFPSWASAWAHLGFDTTFSVPKPTTSTPLQWVETQETGTNIELENPTRIQMVCLAGKTVVDLLHTLDFPCALFGSLACFMYGNGRSPNDVDILALPRPGNKWTTDHLKHAIVRANTTNFFLIPARDPAATYQVLYYRLTDSMAGQTPCTSCKVDIVFPGTLHLPNLPLTQIWWDDALPLVPFSVLLLQKLQGWDDHRTSSDKLKKLRQQTDAQDVQGLLKLSMCVALRFTQPWGDRRLFSAEFERLSRIRVKEFCSAFTEEVDWISLGFETAPASLPNSATVSGHL